MNDPRDYRLDLSSGPISSNTAAPDKKIPPRPYLSVHFACCGVYQRLYRDPAAAVYQGRCPRCARPVRFPVGADGTAARCFTVR